ncbi:MAG: ATP-grasp domain-containing protein [Planctomycetota bacterium]
MNRRPMKVVCFEYVTGGGAYENPALFDPGGSFLREGAAMLLAVLADLRRVPGVSLRVLRDRRLANLKLPIGESVDVASAVEFVTQVAREARLADRVFLIAPECGGVLGKCIDAIEAAGGTPLTPSGELVRIASDKNETARCLNAAGVPVPFGICLGPGEALPRDFTYPAVLKPADGAGSADVRLIPAWRSSLATPFSDGQWRLERFMPGRAASVSVLAIDGSLSCFPPCWQHLSDDGRFEYRGGATPIPRWASVRAEALARAAVAALPPSSGIFGFDVVLAESPTGQPSSATTTETIDGNDNSTTGRFFPGDVVIEVNPRLTTSYLGIRRLLVDNPMEVLLTGRIPALWRLATSVSPESPIVFTAEKLTRINREE